jgi:hypothetical protein
MYPRHRVGQPRPVSTNSTGTQKSRLKVGARGTPSSGSKSVTKHGTISNTAASSSSGGSSSRIRVVIRVRPLSSGEVARGHQSTMTRTSEQSFTIWDPALFEYEAQGGFDDMDPTCWSRQFGFDDCLWSMDRNEPFFANQDTVYTRVGEPLLQMMSDGFNCCVFAYGQTGAGKTKTMMGDVQEGNPEEFGLIPRICFGLFDLLERKGGTTEGADGSGSSVEMETVDYSHIEIYNENVRDLLASQNQGYLKVREHPRKGVFVANLTTVRVKSFEDVMSLIEIGEKNRTVAATNVNLHSSRSHGIVTLTLCQRVRQSKSYLPTSGLQEKVARLHMVDLAGSERVTSSGAQGLRLREANNINKSLSTLGDVIKCLGEPKARRGHIPYRNSTLTNLLRDSLGGNSHVLFVAAVSPSTADYDETLSTLKFAERAKRVKLRVEANVTTGLEGANFSPDMVPLLQAEVNKLRQMLKVQQEQQYQQYQLYESMNHQGYGNSASKSPNRRVRFADEDNDERESEYKEAREQQERSMMTEMKKRVQELEEELARREQLIQSLERGRQESEQEAAIAGEIVGVGVDTTLDSVTTSLASEHQSPATPMRSTSVASYNNKHSSPQRAITETIKATRASPSSSRRNNPIGDIKHGNSNDNNNNVSNEDENPSELSSRNQPVVLLNEDIVDTSQPRVINLNQDPLFSECLVYYIPTGLVTAGSDEQNSDILLSGPDILAKHCVFKNVGGSVSLEPFEDAQIFVNGDHIKRDTTTAPVPLKHCDRLSLGRFHLFRFEGPGEVKPQDSDRTGPVFDWEFAQTELLTKNQALLLRKPRGVALGDDISSQNTPQTMQQHQTLLNSGGSGGIKVAPTGRLVSTTGTSMSNTTTPTSTPLVTPSVTPLVPNVSNVQLSIPTPGNVTETALWEKVTRVAEGHERADEAELHEMLRMLVSQAENHGQLLQANAAASSSSSLSFMSRNQTRNQKQEKAMKSSSSNSSSGTASLLGMTPSPNSLSGGSLLGSTNSRSSPSVGSTLVTGSNTNTNARSSARTLSQRATSLLGSSSNSSSSNSSFIVGESSSSELLGGSTSSLRGGGYTKRSPRTDVPALLGGVSSASAATISNGTKTRTTAVNGITSKANKEVIDLVTPPSSANRSGNWTAPSTASSSNYTPLAKSSDEGHDNTGAPSVSGPIQSQQASSSLSSTNFETEALQLQRELEEMQATLKSRVKRYQDLQNGHRF